VAEKGYLLIPSCEGWVSNGVTMMTNCTISGNTAVFGGGVYAPPGATTLFLANTIIAGNTAPGGELMLTEPSPAKATT